MITHIYQYTTPIRLDRFLKQLYPDLTQGLIQNALRRSLLKVNGAKAKDASLRLVEADEVRVPEHFAQYASKKKYEFNPSVVALSKKLLGQYLIFSNDDFIVINKTAKIATQGGSGISLSIDDALKYLNTEGGNFKLVHRLDKETSGLMLIAKHYDAAVKLTGAFRDKQVAKTYLAMASGTPKAQSGVIEIDNEVTKYRVLKYNNISKIAYIEFKPITGKEHQIRRHSLELGVCIIGDKKYGKGDGAYMLLHSYKAGISAEVFGKSFEFTVPLPDYFNNVLESL